METKSRYIGGLDKLQFAADQVRGPIMVLLYIWMKEVSLISYY